MSDTTKKRGRPASGQAISNAERQRRYIARLKERAGAQLDLSLIVGNPEHQRLFAIPEMQPSASTALLTQKLPDQHSVTGDLEVDAALWLREVCQTTTDVHVVQKALEAAARIKTPAKDLERRYSDMILKSGGHPMQAAFGSIDIANIERHAKSALTRIERNALGMAVFGSYKSAIALTPAEQMLIDTAEPRLPEGDYWGLKEQQLTMIFEPSVNPTTLSEVVNEIKYWRWLYEIRDAMEKTAYPGYLQGDEIAIVSVRHSFLEWQFLQIDPISGEEARQVAQLMRTDETVYNEERCVEILIKLVEWATQDTTQQGLKHRC